MEHTQNPGTCNEKRMKINSSSSDQTRSRKAGSKVGRSVNGGEHQTHILTERERRKKMRNMFDGLHSLLPQLPAKTDKSSIVDEAIKYIQSLQQELQTLENQKLEKVQGESSNIVIDSETSAAGGAIESKEASPPNNDYFQTLTMTAPLSPPANCFQTWFSPNVVLNTCGNEGQISVCSPNKPGLLTSIVCILEKHSLDLVSAHVSSDQHRSIYMIHARAGGACGKYALSAEDTFKLAAGEINLWLFSS